jgi:hypothetical protein
MPCRYVATIHNQGKIGRMQCFQFIAPSMFETKSHDRRPAGPKHKMGCLSFVFAYCGAFASACRPRSVMMYSVFRSF